MAGRWSARHRSAAPGCIVDGSIANMDEVSATIHRLLAKSGTRTKKRFPGPAGICRHHQKSYSAQGPFPIRKWRFRLNLRPVNTCPLHWKKCAWIFASFGPNAKNPGDVDVLLAATRKEKAHERQDAAEIAGLKPTVLDIESYAALLAVQRVLDHPQAPAHVGEADFGRPDQCGRSRVHHASFCAVRKFCSITSKAWEAHS